LWQLGGSQPTILPNHVGWKLFRAIGTPPKSATLCVKGGGRGIIGHQTFIYSTLLIFKGLFLYFICFEVFCNESWL
jgi:hypothetical protein